MHMLTCMHMNLHMYMYVCMHVLKYLYIPACSDTCSLPTQGLNSCNPKAALNLFPT